MFVLEVVAITAAVVVPAYFLVGRTLERTIAWRYLYVVTAGRGARTGIVLSGVVMVIGTAALVISRGENAYGVLLLVTGMIMGSVFLLLSVFSVFTTVSVLGVMLGVSALTIVLSVTTGFQKEFRDKVLGVNAHVIIEKSEMTFADYREVMKVARGVDPDVLGVQPFILAPMLVTRGQGVSSGVALKGVDPELVNSVLDLDKHMVPGAGSVASLAKPLGPHDEPPIILGKALAEKLKAKVGDDVTVVVPLSNIDFDTLQAKSGAPTSRKFKVTGIFDVGFDEYDRALMYTSLQASQDLLGRGDQVLGVELKVKDVNRAAEIAHKLEVLLGPPFTVQDWYDLNHNLFTALDIQQLVLVVILTLIIIVAAVNMVSALTMMVTDKTREIAILKSMGATSGNIGRTFQILGLAIGGVGTGFGLAIGLVICYVVAGYGYHLDPKVYLIDKLPIEVQPLKIGLVAGLTMVISLGATWAPARTAQALTPIEGLRYD